MTFFARLMKAIQTFFAILGGAEISLADEATKAGSEPVLASDDREPKASEVELEGWSPVITQLLSAFQREGRLVDFLMDDIHAASDADIGAAARVVHRGCRKVMDSYFELAPIWPGEEGTHVTIESGFDPKRIELIGANDVTPVSGTLAHGGWCLRSVSMPVLTDAFQSDVLQKAEIER